MRETRGNRGVDASVAHAAEEVRPRVADIRRVVGDLRRQTEEHPGRAIAAAAGAGFLLGGGLFSPLTARLLGVGLRLGLRLAVLPWVLHGAVDLGRSMMAPVPPGFVPNNDPEPEMHSDTRSQRYATQKETLP